jgi:hypothetical protein
VRTLKPGRRLHVWGKPRVSFAEISRLARANREGAKLEGKLPYEIVVFGIY